MTKHLSLKDIISKIIPQQDMRYLPDSTIVDIMLDL